MIEWIWGKKRILDVYVNVIETGKGIYGIQAAAKTHFKKDAVKLTRREAAMIASSLPNPKRYTVKPLSRYVANRNEWVLHQMRFLEKDKDVQAVLTSPPAPLHLR
jgi:monofunctional biosynthetic peptidoglycan transglycosylase